jgi:hypothetical protein
VVRYGGQIVHGSQPVLTPVVAEQARRQVRESSEGIVPLKLFASQLFGKVPEVTLHAARMAQADVVLISQIGEGSTRDPDTFNKSLTAMRLAMMQQVDIVVAIGGKLHVETGFNPGVLEELAQARWHGVPCFVVGAFGGATGQLDLPVVEELSAGNFLESTPFAAEMATWSDSMDEYVGRLLAHFARYKDEFIKRRRIEHGISIVASSILDEDVADARFGSAIKVVSVDPAVAGEWSKRFFGLKRAVDDKDMRQVRRLLSTQGREESGSV